MRLLDWLCWLFAGRLPIGVTDFDRWCRAVIRIAGVPDNRSTRFCLAMVIQGGKTARISKRYAADQVRKLCANEVAQFVTKQLKDAQRSEWEAEKAASGEATPSTPVEVTTESPVVPSESQKQSK